MRAVRRLAIVAGVVIAMGCAPRTGAAQGNAVTAWNTIATAAVLVNPDESSTHAPWLRSTRLSMTRSTPSIGGIDRIFATTMRRVRRSMRRWPRRRTMCW